MPYNSKHLAYQGIVIFLILTSLLWIAYNILTPVLIPTPEQPILLYANENGDDLQKLFVQEINAAKKRIIFTVYTLTDIKIIKALNAKAEQGLEVVIVLDKKGNSGIKKKLSPKINLLQRQGKGITHQKIFIFDDFLSFVGSANLTKDSLWIHGNLVTGFYSKEMNEWMAKKALSLPLKGPIKEKFPYKAFIIGDQTVEWYFLPDVAHANFRVKELIRSAKKTINVAMFTFTRQEFAQELVHASLRGVNVSVLIDHQSALGASQKILTLLAKGKMYLGVNKSLGLLHHKYMVIDNQILLNGSANWTLAAFHKNDDCFYILSPLSPLQKHQLDTLWQTQLFDAVPVPQDKLAI